MSDILTSNQARNGPVTSPAMFRMGDPHDTPEGDTAHHDFSFGDLIDIINPLQHIPGVADVYRAVTDDTISEPARFMGSMLFMGPVGLAMTTADTVAMSANGQRASERLVAAFGGGQVDSTAVVATTQISDTPQPVSRTATPITTGMIGPSLPKGQSDTLPELQNITGSLLDNFIKSQGQGSDISSNNRSVSQNLFAAADPSQLAAVTTPITRAAHAADSGKTADTVHKAAQRLVPPTAVNNQSGTELSSWMMRALDQYRAQAQNRPPQG